MAPPVDIGGRTREALRTAFGPLGAAGSEGMVPRPALPALTVRARCVGRARREALSSSQPEL